MASSLDARQDMVVVEVPKLGKEAATKAIKEWGQPKSKITHLVFCTTSGVDMPGADYQLTKLLGLRPSVKRLMMYQQGCFAGGTVLRLAKDLAENNKGARVLVVCSEITAVTFRGPSDTHLDSLVGQALFGDGAAALIVGADPVPGVEKPLFELVFAAQTILPDSDGAIDGHLREVGLTFHLLKDVPGLISKNIEKNLVEAFQPLGITDWNSLFWIAHPGALDQELSSPTLPSTEELSYQAYADSMHGAFGARSQNDGQHKLLSHLEPHHALFDEVKRRELEADIDAWKKAKFLELVDELERKEAAISIWEFEKTKKAMEEMEKLESKLERKRLREIEKTQKKIGRINKEANKKKSKARRSTIEEISAVSALTEKIRATKSFLLLTLKKFC